LAIAFAIANGVTPDRRLYAAIVHRRRVRHERVAQLPQRAARPEM
jgi:hypothetical protein